VLPQAILGLATVNRLVAAVLLLSLPGAARTAAGAESSICGGTHMPIDTSVLGEPLVNLALGANEGNFVIDTGATQSQVDARRYGVPEGAKIPLSGFSLPLAQGGIFIAADLRSFAAHRDGELGVIGTDFLSLSSIEFHYARPQPYVALGRMACEQAAMRRAGFVEVGLPGYYEANLNRLKRGMPNVPVIGLRIGLVTFPAQVDTGYGDKGPQGVVQVNAALMRTLSAAEMPMHSVLADVVTTDCSGTYNYERWQVEDEELSVVTPSGDVVASYPPPLLELKTNARCGGISALTEPFAQIGASWLSRWGTSVFDGLSSAVWILTGR
jgi:hypothetical protein